MEDVLGVYQRPYDPLHPVVCIDETNKQLIKETRIPCEPGQPEKVDSVYERNGVADLFMISEPLAGKREAIVTETRKAVDFADVLKFTSDTMYPDAEKIILFTDNLNIHESASLYKKFSPEEAYRIANRFEWHYTPIHGSWLNKEVPSVKTRNLKFVSVFPLFSISSFGKNAINPPLNRLLNKIYTTNICKRDAN
jgi:hypothetical protein